MNNDVTCSAKCRAMNNCKGPYECHSCRAMYCSLDYNGEYPLCWPCYNKHKNNKTLWLFAGEQTGENEQ